MNKKDRTVKRYLYFHSIQFSKKPCKTKNIPATENSFHKSKAASYDCKNDPLLLLVVLSSYKDIEVQKNMIS